MRLLTAMRITPQMGITKEAKKSNQEKLKTVEKKK